MRSVTLARLLNKRGIETLACGVDKDYSDLTIQLLTTWAEVIFIQKDSLGKFRKRYAAALNDGERWSQDALFKMNTGYDVGPDDWKMPQTDSLMMMMRMMVDANLELWGSVIDPNAWVVARV